MKMTRLIIAFISSCILLTGCDTTPERQDSASPEDVVQVEGSYLYDYHFLKRYLPDLIVLESESGYGRVLLAPSYQGRVMSSTAHAEEGRSYGWINYELIASGSTGPHMNAFGGEDRFWLGPEGGQYALFFPPGADFTFENWQTPGVIDTAAYEVVSRSRQQAVFQKEAILTNYAGTEFRLRIDRTVRMLNADSLESLLQLRPDTTLRWVGFASDNSITNTGQQSWQQPEGLLSIWILGMFKHSPGTTLVIPYRQESAVETAVVKDDYFGKVPEDRLRIEEGYIFFRGDGAYRSKIGVAPRGAMPVLGSYDAEQQLLTLVSYTLPEGATDYVNSMWEIQEEPYGGDAVNAYNDGPLEDGTQMGPFYEMETSSPAASLAPGEHIQHIHRTFHFQGSEAQLDSIARKALGIGIARIKTVFKAEN